MRIYAIIAALGLLVIPTQVISVGPHGGVHTFEHVANSPLTVTSQPPTNPDSEKHPLDVARGLALRYGKFKQVDSRTGRPNNKLGRTPGSACSILRFLVSYAGRYSEDVQVHQRVRELSEWIISLQITQRDHIAFGGVPSTPDLNAPKNAFFYAIDAALCGDAMLRAHELTRQESYFSSAKRFGDFLLAAFNAPPGHQVSDDQRGFCEYVAVGKKPVWNCDYYVKNLIALPVLKRLSGITGEDRYARAAAQARGFLLEGLAGSWEYATLSPRRTRQEAQQRDRRVWRRVAGPHHEPNMFIYGDTVAYGLRGLFDYEGTSQDVVSIYRRFSEYKGDREATRAYDGRVAFAGYLHVATTSPDMLTRYYDLVTLGILHKLKRAVDPLHHELANKLLLKKFFPAATRSWRIGFDLEMPVKETIDLTTIASLGEALLEQSD